MSATTVLSVAISVAALVSGVVKFVSYLAARMAGMSKADYILKTAGGAERLRRRAISNRRFAYLLMITPILVVAWGAIENPHAKHINESWLMILVFEAMCFPGGLILLWDARQSIKIADKAEGKDYSTRPRTW